jgi:hypothetical protein
MVAAAAGHQRWSVPESYRRERCQGMTAPVGVSGSAVADGVSGTVSVEIRPSAERAAPCRAGLARGCRLQRLRGSRWPAPSGQPWQGIRARRRASDCGRQSDTFVLCLFCADQSRCIQAR